MKRIGVFSLFSKTIGFSLSLEVSLSESLNVMELSFNAHEETI